GSFASHDPPARPDSFTLSLHDALPISKHDRSHDNNGMLNRICFSNTCRKPKELSTDCANPLQKPPSLSAFLFDSSFASLLSCQWCGVTLQQHLLVLRTRSLRKSTKIKSQVHTRGPDSNSRFKCLDYFPPLVLTRSGP